MQCTSIIDVLEVPSAGLGASAPRYVMHDEHGCEETEGERAERGAAEARDGHPRP